MFNRLRDWLKTAWHLLRSYIQTLRGAWRVAALAQPVVSIFGGARIGQDYHYAKKAAELGGMLSQADISVLTGGGPGIMQAVSCGINPLHDMRNSKGKTFGIGVRGLGDEKPNPCLHDYIELNYFFARKWLLTRYASGVVFFPGGFGTLDELFELITLVQTKKNKPIPIVLFGVEFWSPMYDWITHELYQHGFVTQQEMQLFTITDDLDKVFCLLRDECTVEPPMRNKK